ncbi:hypothetical protein VPH35_110219 [Triticum aestivum]
MQLVSWPVHSSPFFPALCRGRVSRGGLLTAGIMVDLGMEFLLPNWELLGSGVEMIDSRPGNGFCVMVVSLYTLSSWGISRLLAMDLRESNLECAPWMDHTKQYRWLLILFNYYLKRIHLQLILSEKKMCSQDVF